MEKEAIEKIESLVLNGQTVEVDGQKFSAKDLAPVIYTPAAKALTVHSLLGFCAYINNAEFDKLDKKDLMVIVNGTEKVELVSPLYGKDKIRETLARAELADVEQFPFEDFMSQEKFAIKFRSLFVPDAKNDTNYVLTFASKMSGGTNIETADDGITQNVGVRRGVSGNLVGKEAAKPIVRLRPFRTFREIVQPESEFLLRSRLDSNDAPTLALFEADGGAWKITAMNAIAEYISSMCPGVKIIA